MFKDIFDAPITVAKADEKYQGTFPYMKEVDLPVPEDGSWYFINRDNVPLDTKENTLDRRSWIGKFGDMIYILDVVKTQPVNHKGKETQKFCHIRILNTKTNNAVVTAIGEMDSFSFYDDFKTIVNAKNSIVYAMNRCYKIGGDFIVATFLPKSEEYSIADLFEDTKLNKIDTMHSVIMGKFQIGGSLDIAKNITDMDTFEKHDLRAIMEMAESEDESDYRRAAMQVVMKKYMSA